MEKELSERRKAPEFIEKEIIIEKIIEKPVEVIKHIIIDKIIEIPIEIIRNIEGPVREVERIVEKIREVPIYRDIEKKGNLILINLN